MTDPSTASIVQGADVTAAPVSGDVPDRGRKVEQYRLRADPFWRQGVPFRSCRDMMAPGFGRSSDGVARAGKRRTV